MLLIVENVCTHIYFIYRKAHRYEEAHAVKRPAFPIHRVVCWSARRGSLRSGLRGGLLVGSSGVVCGPVSAASGTATARTARWELREARRAVLLYQRPTHGAVNMSRN